MARIGIIDDSGQEAEAEVFSKNATIQSGTVGTLNPSVVQSIKFDNKGMMSSITTECGETENRREGNNKAKVTVEGIITEDEVNEMRSLREQEQITFVSDIVQNEMIIERLSITQKSDLNWIEINGQQELAFSFQIQLKEP